MCIILRQGLLILSMKISITIDNIQIMIQYIVAPCSTVNFIILSRYGGKKRMVCFKHALFKGFHSHAMISYLTYPLPGCINYNTRTASIIPICIVPNNITHFHCLRLVINITHTFSPECMWQHMHVTQTKLFWHTLHKAPRWDQIWICASDKCQIPPILHPQHNTLTLTLTQRFDLGIETKWSLREIPLRC